MVGHRYRYSRWDGTQAGFEFDAQDLLGEVADDLLYHGDPNAALRRLMQDGFNDRNDQRVQGLRELMERLRSERQERLDRHDLGGVFDEIAQELNEVVDTEQQALEATERSADEQLRRANADKQLALDLLPDDLAGRVRSLQNYEFVSPEAQQSFDELLDKLRQQLVQQQVDQMAGAMEATSPEDLNRHKDMLSELNQMLEQRQNGEEPDFDGFMERHGEFFPENPSTLDELLETLAQRMAAMQAMMNSMTPEQRRQLQDLSDQLLEDLDLSFEMSRLGDNLRQQFPDAGWQRSYQMEGFDPLGLADAMPLFEELGQIDQLERFLSSATSPQSLAEVDLEQVERLLGPESAESLERVAELAKQLEEQGLIQSGDGQLELTPEGLRRLGQKALSELFSKLSPSLLGQHATSKVGFGHERSYQTKPYEFGDSFNLNIERTVGNALRRGGGGTPVRLTPGDFEIEQTERQVRSSTVLMLDLSMSMPIRDNFLPAKKVAMALHALISSQFPRDYLGIVSFSSVAKELRASDLPAVSWDLAYGTNMHHGFRLSRSLLASQAGTKQIIMITDGEPTAHLLEDGSPYFNYPPTRETLEHTMAEAKRCSRAGIVINTFMLEPDAGLRGFIERLSEINRGRAFYTTPENLGDYVLFDFIDGKRRLL